MARVTLADMRARLRRMLDIESDSDDGYYSAAELNEWLLEAWQELYECRAKGDPDYAEDIQAITSTGSDSVTLPGDHLETKGVDYEEGSGCWTPLRKVTFRERNDYPDDVSGAACAYRVVGNKLVLYPTPPSGQSYRHIYIPTAPDWSEDDDVIDGGNGWEALVLRAAAISAREKEEGDTTGLERQYERKLARVTARAGERSIDETPVIADIEDYNDPMWPRAVMRRTRSS